MQELDPRVRAFFDNDEHPEASWTTSTTPIGIGSNESPSREETI
ncbi:hypothetical protein [Agromyces badenianii]|nr:hypothetical protein [Agromyces badenianii]